MDKLEYVEKGEILYNYVLMEYSPLELCNENSLLQRIPNFINRIVSLNKNSKLRICNILYKSLENTTIVDSFINLIKELRNEIGLNQTIWGIKNINGTISWEIYFYRHLQPENIKLKRILKIINRHFNADDLLIDEDLPYLMFSVDINKAMKITNANVYFGKYFGESFHSWSYSISKDKTEFFNHYEFFNPQDFSQLSEKILLSPFVNHSIDISKILIPDFIACKSICIATKRYSNGIYYQGINLKLFLYFLEKFDYPANLVSLVKGHKKQLDYILFDVGFDYSVENGKLVFGKSGFYGTF